MDEQFPHKCPMCGERVFGNQEMMVHAATKHPDPRDAEIVALRAKLKQAEEERDEAKRMLSADGPLVFIKYGYLTDLQKALAAKDAELAECNRELDEAVELLKALGQQQTDDFKAHKAELALYRKAVGPVVACRDKWRGCQHAQVVMKERDCEAWDAVKNCIRILGEGSPKAESGKEGE